MRGRKTVSHEKWMKRTESAQLVAKGGAGDEGSASLGPSEG